MAARKEKELLIDIPESIDLSGEIAPCKKHKAFLVKDGTKIIINTSNRACKKLGYCYGYFLVHGRQCGVVLGVAKSPEFPNLGERIWAYWEGDKGISFL